MCQLHIQTLNHCQPTEGVMALKVELELFVHDVSKLPLKRSLKTQIGGTHRL